MKSLPLHSTIGVLGSGQLGRMLGLAARRMGYRVHVFSPEADSPLGQIADLETVAAYNDLDALKKFAASIDVLTFEFENIPFETASLLEKYCPVHPSPRILHIAQHREREKTFLREAGFPVVPFAVVRGPGDVEKALSEVGLPAVLKTSGFGYDGKGQTRLTSEEAARAAVQDGSEYVWEQWQDFEKEVSVVVARGVRGEIADWGVVENRHRNHILDTSFSPALVSHEVRDRALGIAHALAQKLELVGVLCVEFFVGRDGTVRINEIAPRPHNSGHWTIEGSVTSQFEQQLRAVCGLELGSTERTQSAAAMVNLLGDLWEAGEPNWGALLAHPRVKLHWYGKKEPRSGRKMGHVTAIASTVEEAVERATRSRDALRN